MVTVTPDQIKASLGVLKAIADAIKELKEVPSGELYARVMNTLSLEEYNTVIGILKQAGVITESNYLLKWNI